MARATGRLFKAVAFVNGETLANGDTMTIDHDTMTDTIVVSVQLRAENYHPRPLTLQEVTHLWARST